jgi:hypothetical protein
LFVLYFIGRDKLLIIYGMAAPLFVYWFVPVGREGRRGTAIAGNSRSMLEMRAGELVACARSKLAAVKIG